MQAREEILKEEKCLKFIKRNCKTAFYKKGSNSLATIHYLEVKQMTIEQAENVSQHLQSLKTLKIHMLKSENSDVGLFFNTLKNYKLLSTLRINSIYGSLKIGMIRHECLTHLNIGQLNTSNIDIISQLPQYFPNLEYFGELEFLNEKVVHALSQFEKLHQLCLSSKAASFPPNQIEFISPLLNLKSLVFGKTCLVGDQLLKQICNHISGLKQLTIPFAMMTDEGLNCLSIYQESLCKLYIHSRYHKVKSMKITQASFYELVSKFVNLTGVSIVLCPILKDSKALSEILPNLRSLNVFHSSDPDHQSQGKILNQILEKTVKLTKLQCYASVNHEAVNKLKSLASLKSLSLFRVDSGCQINLNDWLYISQMKQLDFLKVKGYTISKQSKDRLTNLLSHADMDIEDYDKESQDEHERTFQSLQLDRQ